MAPTLRLKRGGKARSSRESWPIWSCWAAIPRTRIRCRLSASRLSVRWWAGDGCGRVDSLIFAVEDSAKHAQRTVLVAASLSGRQFPPELVDGHTLDDHSSRPGHGGEKQALAAEQRCLDAAHELDVVVHCLVESHDAAGVNLQHLARPEIELDEIAAGVDEDGPGTDEFFENESFASEETRAQLFHQRHSQLHRG